MQPERGLEPGRPAFRSRLPIRVDRSWIPAGALLAAHLSFSAFGDRRLISSLAFGVLTASVLFLCVVLHAVGHLLVARMTGTEGARSRLYVFGDAPDSPRTASVAIAGPAMSAVLAAAMLAGSSLLSGAIVDVMRTAGWASAGVAAINLVPGYPLDGGHLLASITGRRRLAVRTGQSFGVAAIIAAGYLLLSGPEALDDTAFGLWFLLAGIFVLVEARTAERTVPRLPLDGESAGAWARPFAGRVAASDPVPPAGGPYAVSDGSRLAGVLAAGVRTKGDKRCADVMVPWTSQLGIRAETPLRTALERLAKDDASLVVVVDAKGIVRGVLDEDAVRTRIAR